MYAELHAYSNFSFLEGGSPPEALVQRAVELGLHALAVTDRQGFYGSVRFHEAARQAGLKAIIGSDLDMEGGDRLTLLIRNAVGYANLSALLTRAFARCERGQARISYADLFESTEGLLLLAGRRSEAGRRLDNNDVAGALHWFERAREAFGAEHAYLEAYQHLRYGDNRRIDRLHDFSSRHGFPVVATNDVRYATAADRALYDVLSCVREHTTIEKAGLLLEPNAERRLKSAREMFSLFPAHATWVQRSIEVAEKCDFHMSDIRYRLPSYPTPEGETADDMLRRLAYEGARSRYGTPLPAQATQQIEHELAIIGKLGFAGYFLIVWDIVRFCRERGILCQGRGSAANSAVCYCLGITSVDPVGMALLFERFLSVERAEAPDIDLDIAHNYREPVLQYVYERYGREHAAMVCEVITYKGRSAIRDVGKALGFGLHQVDRMAKHIQSLPGMGGMQSSGKTMGESDIAIPPEWGVDNQSPRLRKLLDIVSRIDGYPRHLSIHVGGFVIAAEPLCRLVPIEPASMEARTIIQWDKDDAETMGMIKIDLLGLGMLTLLQDGFDLIARNHGKRYALYELDYEDPRIYDMLCEADTVGVFQVESRAQMSTLPRLKPRRFYDLVVEVALIRPGPIQGDMVHPYLRRRDGEEPITYAHPELAPILERTLGVPLFQEQGMRVAITAAGFTPGEADQLRKAMGSKRSHARMLALFEKLRTGMKTRGYDQETAERIVNQLTAFADYGFPESHAASFALLVYASAWMKVYYPAEFYASLLNAQPMGFYSPATIVEDARRHGIRVLPLDINASQYDCTVEDGALRIGFRYIRGFGAAYRGQAERIIRSRPFTNSAQAFASLAGLPMNLQRNLATAGAFTSLGLDRRSARWALEKYARPPLGPLAPYAAEIDVPLTPMSRVEEMQADYRITGMAFQDHPLSFYRDLLTERGCKRAVDLRHTAPGSYIAIGGLVIIRQRPATARGMLFITLEDETGMANLVVFPNVLQRLRSVLTYRSFILVRGKLERAHQVTNLIVQQAEPLPGIQEIKQLEFKARNFR